MQICPPLRFLTSWARYGAAGVVWLAIVPQNILRSAHCTIQKAQTSLCPRKSNISNIRQVLSIVMVWRSQVSSTLIVLTDYSPAHSCLSASVPKIDQEPHYNWGASYSALRAIALQELAPQLLVDWISARGVVSSSFEQLSALELWKWKTQHCNKESYKLDCLYAAVPFQFQNQHKTYGSWQIFSTCGLTDFYIIMWYTTHASKCCIGQLWCCTCKLYFNY